MTTALNLVYDLLFNTKHPNTGGREEGKRPEEHPSLATMSQHLRGFINSLLLPELLKTQMKTDGVVAAAKT